MEQIKKYLIPILKAILAGNATNSEINLLVKIAHHFALTRLRQIIFSQKIHLEIYPHSVSSVALNSFFEPFFKNQDRLLQEIFKRVFHKNINRYKVVLISEINIMLFLQIDY